MKRRGGVGSGVSGHSFGGIDPIAFEFAIESRTFDAENQCGLGFVPSGAFENRKDVSTFEIFEGDFLGNGRSGETGGGFS